MFTYTLSRAVADAELLPDEPSELEEPADEPIELSDLEYEDLPCTDDFDDAPWEAFIPDDDEFDPQPGPSDFWFESRSGPSIDLQMSRGVAAAAVGD